MELALVIYFVDVVCGNGVVALFGWIYFGLLTFLWGVSHDSAATEFCEGVLLKVSKTGYKLLACSLIVFGSLVPPQDTAYKMLAAYGVTEIAQNKRVQELGGKSLQVLETAMDKYLKAAEQ